MSWTIYSKNGTPRYKVHAIELQEEWMVSDCVMVTITSHQPITLEIGDFLFYRGAKYSVYNMASTLKTARSGSCGDAFKMENVKFYSDFMGLSELRFLDYVLSDSGLHFSSLPEFSFYAETVDDLVDRLQANADLTNSGFIFLTPNKDRTVQRIGSSRFSTKFPYKLPICFGYTEPLDLWESLYGENGERIDSGRDVRNREVKVSNNNLSEGLAMVYNDFGMHFVVRGKTVIIGLSGEESNHIFKYGKGLGLSSIERNVDEEQQLVTRLYAYGSNTNMPPHYYAELNLQVYSNVTSIVRADDTVARKYLAVTIDLPYSGIQSLFTNPIEDANIYAGQRVYWVKATIGNTPIEGFVRQVSGDSPHVDFETSWPGLDSYGDVDPTALSSIISNIAVGSTIYFTGYVKKEAFPASNKSYSGGSGSELPNNMAVGSLMLPGFPKYALSDLCLAIYTLSNDKTAIKYRKTPSDSYKTIMTLDGKVNLRFSQDRYRPYIESGDAVDEYGVKEGTALFVEQTDENGLEDIHPSVEELTVSDVGTGTGTERIDALAQADIIQDNGVFAEGTTIPTFHVTLKNLGFDLKEAFINAGKGMTLSMKDGYCGGREFSVSNVQENANGTWNVTLQRLPDNSLAVYFPYSYNASISQTPVADEPYQLRGANIQNYDGDHFVLLGIELGDTNYVEAAAVKLLKKSITWLLANNAMRYTYTPAVDEIFMARERDEAESLGRASLHDWIKAGMRLHFQEDDFGIDGSVFIDRLTIKEGESAIPKYEVVLREKKQVSTFQRALNQIQTYNSGNGGGGVTANQVESIGSKHFLSKKYDDTAEGKITFKGKTTHNNGLEAGNAVVNGTSHLKGDTTFGTNALVRDASGAGVYSGTGGMTIETDYLNVHKKMFVKEVQVQETTYIGGCVVNSPANGFTITGIEEDAAGWELYFDEQDSEKKIAETWRTGDQALSQNWNIQSLSGSDISHRWWRLVTGVGVNQNSSSDYYGRKYIYVSKTDCEPYSDNPVVGDKVVMLGHQAQYGETDAEERQGAIIEASAGGGDVPYIRIYRNISTFDLAGATLITEMSYKQFYVLAERMKILTSESVGLKLYYIDDNDNLREAQLGLTFDESGQETKAVISADNINLNGVVTANGFFKINLNGSMEATSGSFSGHIKSVPTIIHEHNIEKFFNIEINPFTGRAQFMLDVEMLGRNSIFFVTSGAGGTVPSVATGSATVSLEPTGYGKIQSLLERIKNEYRMDDSSMGLILPYTYGHYTDSHFLNDIVIQFGYNDETHTSDSTIGLNNLYKYWLWHDKGWNVMAAQNATRPLTKPDDMPQEDWDDWGIAPFRIYEEMTQRSRDYVDSEVTIAILAGSTDISAINVYGVKPIGGTEYPYDILSIGGGTQYNTHSFKCEQDSQTINILWDYTNASIPFWDRYTLGLEDWPE